MYLVQFEYLNNMVNCYEARLVRVFFLKLTLLMIQSNHVPAYIKYFTEFRIPPLLPLLPHHAEGHGGGDQDHQYSVERKLGQVLLVTCYMLLCQY